MADDPLLAAVVAGDAAHREETRADQRGRHAREEGLVPLFANDGEEGVRRTGVPRLLAHQLQSAIGLHTDLDEVEGQCAGLSGNAGDERHAQALEEVKILILHSRVHQVFQRLVEARADASVNHLAEGSGTHSAEQLPKPLFFDNSHQRLPNASRRSLHSIHSTARVLQLESRFRQIEGLGHYK